MKASLFERNLETFRKNGYEDLAKHLANHNLGGLELVRDGDGRITNINLGHAHFYDGDVSSFTNLQLGEYLKSPARFFVQPPLFGSEFLMREEKLYEASYDAFIPISQEQANSLEDSSAGYLVCFGLGLGEHLLHLLDYLDVKELILVEQFGEFVSASCYHIDWDKIFTSISERGGQLTLLLGNDPVQLSNRIHNHLRGRFFGLIDGSYGYQHYHSPVLDQCHDRFRDMLPSLGMSDGFFEDECVMLEHSILNLKNEDRYSLDLDICDHVLAGLPVIIVGSGPSMNDSIEAIRDNAANAIIISAGTGLGILLRAGIKPDFHCEIENLPIVYEAVKSHRQGGLDFSGIHLIAAPSVDPRIPKEFDETTFVFRDSVTASQLMADENLILNTGPTIANFASRVALALGASRIYLFGIDLGAVSKEKHHADDSVYNRTDDKFWKSGLGMLAMDQEVAGNFREIVYSNPLFKQTNIHFTNTIQNHPHQRFYNCSDGAKIEGAIPLKPNLLKLPVISGDQRSKATFQDCRRSIGLNAETLSDLLNKYLNAANSFYEAASQLFSADSSFVGMSEKFQELCRKTDDRYSEAAIKLNKGTFMLMIQFGYFYQRRLPEEQRQSFLTFFCDHLCQDLQQMKTEFSELIAKLKG